MSGILLEQNLTNNRKRRKKNVDVEKDGESREFYLEANGSNRSELINCSRSLLTRSKTSRYESVHFGVVVVELIVNSEE